MKKGNKSTAIVGITGGIGSGKSTAAHFLASKGAILIDADKIASQLLTDQKVKEEIVEEFGESVLDGQGNVYRTYLAHAAFESKKNLEKLNKIMHPRITAEVQAQVEKVEKAVSKKGKNNKEKDLIVIDAPLLFESGLDKLCDVTIFVDTDLDTRLKRTEEQRGWTKEELERREGFQDPPAKKKKKATHSVENMGSTEKMEEQLMEVLDKLKSEQKKSSPRKQARDEEKPEPAAKPTKAASAPREKKAEASG